MDYSLSVLDSAGEPTSTYLGRTKADSHNPERKQGEEDEIAKVRKSNIPKGREEKKHC